MWRHFCEYDINVIIPWHDSQLILRIGIKFWLSQNHWRWSHSCHTAINIMITAKIKWPSSIRKKSDVLKLLSHSISVKYQACRCYTTLCDLMLPLKDRSLQQGWYQPCMVIWECPLLCTGCVQRILLVQLASRWCRLNRLRCPYSQS